MTKKQVVKQKSINRCISSYHTVITVETILGNILLSLKSRLAWCLINGKNDLLPGVTSTGQGWCNKKESYNKEIFLRINHHKLWKTSFFMRRMNTFSQSGYMLNKLIAIRCNNNQKNWNSLEKFFSFFDFLSLHLFHFFKIR